MTVDIKECRQTLNSGLVPHFGWLENRLSCCLDELEQLRAAHKELTEAARYAEGSLSQVPDGVQVPPIVTMDIRDHLRSVLTKQEGGT